jgi:dihydroorotase
VIDPQVRWTVDPATFRSKSSNTPFAGWRLQGRADTVIVGGRVKYRADVEAGQSESRRPVRAR